MKATAQPMAATTTSAEKTRWAVFSDLIKLRLTFLVLVTTFVGFYIGFRGSLNFLLLLHTMLGTALVASGAAALNQLLEREHDSKMRRTEDRPLPSGRMKPRTVLLLGAACGGLGLIYLALMVNLLTSVLGAITLGSYLFVYTPLKRKTTLNTVIGAIPGALPPLMGWTAARDEVTLGGWSLFAILFFWQLPHFFAIAWIYREQYAHAGFMMLPVVDVSGERTGRQAVSNALGLLPVSLAPFVLHLAGPIYLFGAFVLGLAYLWYAIQFSRQLTVPRARQLFFLSILYLPLLLGLMVFDKIK
ncbi:heme o synthase [Pedosphaera parvula]|uniref:Protoheme IX farnesyltransferase n=1 Tax=Pedosphaera parvula (strain Ellin514) TaxID=320771 RepID=B9XST7_PEDPL|nr:heme o synthase [Pedosphaera parvula]EEF57104.1 protoheme IX farnesyltransferase [Pedosphaera parvula Ellin514]